ncbi:hypothetical protein V8C86DRAFT_2467227 [Haematococcus lacustris]|nr:hypothetical protein QJQ45_004958 [Haematococcus lacustris]
MSAAEFPVRTKLFTRDIEDVPTDFSFSLYADRLLLIVTQLGCAGTIISTTSDSAFDTAAPTFSITVLSGKRDEPLLTLCARRIVEAAASQGFTTPMLICLGLKQHRLEVVKGVVAAVEQDNLWRQ